MDQERDLLKKLSDKSAARLALFKRKISERITRHNLCSLEERNLAGFVDSVAETVAKEPTWCPAVRLQSEAFHSIVENAGDKLQDSDLSDLAHLYSLPYVDLFTCDRRVSGYISGCSKRLGADYEKRLFKNISAVVDRLKLGAT